LVPPYLCFLAGASLDRVAGEPSLAVTARVFGRALAFVLGFSLVFIALGAAASSIGRLVSDHLTVLTQLAGVVVAILGLHLLGVFRLFLLMREARFDASAPTGVIGAFVVGLAFAFGWSPCVGPVLASILLVASTDDSVQRGAVLLAAYAAGIGVPFLVAALFTGPFMRWLAGFRRHVGIVQKVMGALLVTTGVLIFVGAMPVIAGWLLEAVPVLGRIG
jgi:cytochrome c-type biogenesis protein